MTSVQRHIQYLVATTDCVIIPGWGGFIASAIPAYVDGHSFFPPARTIVFNPSLTHDDGLLASSLCRREGIDYESARREIDAEVSAMRNAFELTGYVAMPRVGIFRRLADGTLKFDADPTGIASARYATLPTIELPAPAVDNDTLHILPQHHRENIGRRVLRVAAFVAILLGLALTLSTPISINLDHPADFASVGSAPRADRFDIPASPADFRLTIVVPDSALAIAPVASRPAIEALTDADYYLIIGSFDNHAAAEKWMARHSDYSKGIVEYQGRYRVYAATGTSVDDAFRLLHENTDFARKNPEAWVYRRR